MVDVVGLEAFLGVDAYGRPSYSAATVVLGRVEPTHRRVYNPDETYTVATSRVFLPETPVVSPRDRITLPDGSQPRILAVERQGDERGPHHQVVIT